MEHHSKDDGRAEVPPVTRETIVIVDDTPANLQLLANVLQDAGYRVKPAPHGQAALTAIAREIPDLIMLDINMPGMSGYDVCRRLKEDPKLQSVPVLFISALGETIDKVRAFEVGGVDYITKPFHFEEVLARVDTHLSIHRLQRALTDNNQQLRESVKRLEELEAARENLTHMIIHDLRSPLMGIQGYLSLLERAEANQRADKRGTYIRMADQSVQVILRLVNDLLDIGRMEEDKMPLDICTWDLETIVREGIESAGAGASPVQVKLRKPDRPVLARCDAGVIRRVVCNLVANAIRYTPPGEKVEVTIRLEDGVARVDVRDWGPGIPPEMHKTIFEKFSQSEKSPGQGRYTSGLGLTFCQLAIDCHEGTISLKSAPGEGCVFSFTIATPSGRETPFASVPVKRGVQGLKGKRVLLADDAELTVALIRDVLESAGMVVDVVRSGTGAIEAALANTPDLVLLDIHMPGLNGLDVAGRLFESQALEGVPIVALTASTDRELFNRARALGCKGCIQKPINIDTLIDEVARLAGKPFAARNKV